MKSKIVTVHYCDFCKKRSFYRPNMGRHEKGCTMNPNRYCKMCCGMGEEQKPIESAKELLLESLNSIDREVNKAIVERLKTHFNGCPACCLAAIRQLHNMIRYEEYNFKEHCKVYWAEQREARPEDYYPACV